MSIYGWRRSFSPNGKPSEAVFRLRSLSDASEIFEIIQGDALKMVVPLLEELPGRLCILMSYCQGHWSTAALTELHEVLLRASRHRDVHRLDVDPPATESPQTARGRLMRLAEAGITLLKKRSPFTMEYTCYTAGQAHLQRLGAFQETFLENGSIGMCGEGRESVDP